MNPQTLIDLLQSDFAPVEVIEYALKPRTGLVIVDEVKGFAEVGSGPLAPPTENPQVQQMVKETNSLAGRFKNENRPILAFLDTHIPGKPEPPYPPHCEQGSGQETFVNELAWLENEPGVVKVRKDCINGFIGSINDQNENVFSRWVLQNDIHHLITVGICTDICVMDFVLTVLSARNHGLLGSLADIVVYEKACATYDLGKAAVESLGFPKTAIHPQELTHHMGLYMMASRGAIIAGKLR
jgi:nicotinamidase-related amidase